MSADPERGLLPVDTDVTPAAPRDKPTVDDNGELLDTGFDGVELARVSPHVDDLGFLVEIYSGIRGQVSSERPEIQGPEGLTSTRNRWS